MLDKKNVKKLRINKKSAKKHSAVVKLRAYRLQICLRYGIIAFSVNCIKGQKSKNK